MYSDLKVKSKYNQCISDGKVTVAADEREVVESYLKKDKGELDDIHKGSERCLIVQYNKGKKSCVLSVMHQKEVCCIEGES